MARRYDSRTTIFSPEGRLYQVEYAMEAIGNAGSAVGILAKDGVVLAAEKRITSKVRVYTSLLLHVCRDLLKTMCPCACSYLTPMQLVSGVKKCTSWTGMWPVQ